MSIPLVPLEFHDERDYISFLEVTCRVSIFFSLSPPPRDETDIGIVQETYLEMLSFLPEGLTVEDRLIFQEKKRGFIADSERTKTVDSSEILESEIPSRVEYALDF